MNRKVNSQPGCESLRMGAVWDMYHSIACLEVEVDRIIRSQLMMRSANQALRLGCDDMLRSLDFSDAHIAELRARLDAGRDGFPEYLFRNNINLIRQLRRRLDELYRQIERITGESPAADQSRLRKQRRYVCVADNPGNVPFLAGFIPFSR